MIGYHFSPAVRDCTVSEMAQEIGNVLSFGRKQRGRMDEVCIRLEMTDKR